MYKKWSNMFFKLQLKHCHKEINFMTYCLYNAIKTPDGTLLWCKSVDDYQTHKDSVSGEEYMNAGTGDGVRRSVNTVAYEDLSIFSNDPFEKVRTAKFWESYRKDENSESEKVMLSLQEMEYSNISAILKEYSHIRSILAYRISETVLENLFIREIEYRIEVFKDNLDGELPKKSCKNKCPKV